MATEAQIAANKRNAARSTGPRTEAGKKKARGNALKHGGRAATLDVMPVLPHEDPKELERRTAAWLDEWRLGDGSADDLARRGALLAWKLERADRAEAAYLTTRVHNAAEKDAARAVTAADELGRRLYADGRDGLFQKLPKPPWPDAPAPLVARLEETAAGCRWLVEHWGHLSVLLDRGARWLPGDVFRLFRLQGKNVYEADQDPGINGLILALDVLSPGVAGYYEAYFRGLSSSRDPAFKWATRWRELAPRPADKASAEAIVRGVIAERVGRLEAMLGELEEIAELEAEEAADRAAFDPGAGFERSARRQASLGRELLRTVAELRRLRKDSSLDVAGVASPGMPHGQASGPCHAEPSGGCGGGSPGEPTPQECQGMRPGATASTPPPQPRGEDDRPSADREAREHEIATNEAKLESTQEKKGNKVTSKDERHGNDERTQSARVGEGGIAAHERHGLEGRSERRDHESHESDESVRRRDQEEAVFPLRDTTYGESQRMS